MNGTEALAVIGATAFGLACGSVLPLLQAERVEKRVSRAESTPTERRVETACPELPAEDHEALERAWSEQTRAEAALRAAQAEISEFIGEPLAFEGLPDALTPQSIEDAVEGLLDPEAAELQWVDCAEAPCIAVLRLIGPDAHSLPGMRAGAEPLQHGLDVNLGMEWVGIGEEAYLTVPLGPPDLDDAVLHRVDFREESIIAELNQ